MSKSYKSQFYRIIFKKSMRDIPRILGVILIVAVLCATLVLGIVAIFGDSVAKINAAYVFEDEDDWFSVGLKYMAKGANINLRKYNKDDAIDALYDKEVAAVLIINDGDESDSINPALPVDSVKVMYYDSDQFITSMFGTIVNAGVSDYLVLNATRSAVKVTDPDYSRADVNDMEDVLMDYLIGRNHCYKRVVFYDSGDIPIKHYYLGNAMALIILLSASVAMGFTKNDEENFVKTAKRTGISRFDLFMAKYVPFMGLFSVIAVAGMAVFQYASWDELYVEGLLATFLATLVLLSLVILIHEILPDKTVSTLCCIFASIIGMFLSGNIIPHSFLPDVVAQISDFIITKYPTRMYGQSFFGKINYSTMGYAAIGLVVTFGLTFLVSFIRGKMSYENS